MESEQNVQEWSSAIISFANSILQNNERQSESELNSSLSDVTSILQALSTQIGNNSTSTLLIKTQNLLHSLFKLSCFQINTHSNQENDKYSLPLRNRSKQCLWNIQSLGDASVQSELVNIKYIRMLTISICTAGGSGEEQDEEIRIGLFYMFCFLISLHKGKKYPTYLPPLPLLAKTCIEQIEEEGGHEEVDALLNNKGREMHIKVQAIGTYGYILNFFVDQSNTLSWWYNQGA